jgi:hypothetical protein
MKLTNEQREVNRMITHKMFPVLLLLAIGTMVFGFGGEPKPKHAGWGFETWICPNENCRYENYTAIEYCGLCGTTRPIKGRRAYAGDIPVEEYSQYFDVVYFDGHIWVPIILEHHPMCPCNEAYE